MHSAGGARGGWLMHGTKQWAGPTIGDSAADRWGLTGSNTSAADRWVWPEIKCELDENVP
jgi:hypothetical protein